MTQALTPGQARRYNFRMTIWAKATAVAVFVLTVAGSCGGKFDPYNY